ncbi:MAG: dihydroorotate dehydrogenase electron transfer subunit [Bacteroidales bacterium]|nr:dihydroorotate dehydrogenase electron transfer subunit [Bacteroidales bacterium]
MANKVVAQLIVQEITPLAADHFLMRFHSDTGLLPVDAGNFAQLATGDPPAVFLRRPFSIFDADTALSMITFYIKVVGKGTAQLTGQKPGTRLTGLYPLGNSFTIPTNARNALIIAGGSGVAPFLLLSRKLKKQGTHVTFLIGAKNREELVLTDVFQEYGDVETSTEDGSEGFKGLVTEHPILSRKGQLFDQVYSCGPVPMMKAVSRWALKNDIPCELSLENTMACGYGVCLSCVTGTTEGNRCVCTEGPVFNHKLLTWQT